MQQDEIDHQAGINNQASVTVVDWKLIASLLIVVGILVFAFFKVAGVL
jgi:hypothetical protein